MVMLLIVPIEKAATEAFGSRIVEGSAADT
jgi:hypothetical protein